MTKFLHMIIAVAAMMHVSDCAYADPTAAIKDGETIAFLGDSITAGGEEHGGYCRLVMHGLRTKGIRVNGIFAGVPGEKSPDMLLRLDGILKRKPDHLFLLAGVNDVWMTDPTARIGVFKPDPGTGTELEYYKIYIAEILDRCADAGVKVIMSTCTPITEDPEFRLNLKAKAYNAFLLAEAERRSLPIALLNEAFFQRIAEIRAESSDGAARNVLTSDGVHPVGTGYRVMALGILKTMGFTTDELAALEKEWDHSPMIQVIGGRQVRSATRYTGWLTMVLDVLNSGRDMVTPSCISTQKENAADMVKTFLASPRNERIKYLLFVPLMADINQHTPPAEFRASLQSLVDEAKARNLKSALSTYAMVGPDLSSKLNADAAPYNAVIREVAKQNHIALSDIAAVMQDHFAKHPEASLNLEDERFNYEGSILMVETVCNAFEVNTDTLADLRETWSKARCYTFRYSDAISFNVPLSPEGARALEAVSACFHKLKPDKILDFGIHLLLNNNKAENEKRCKVSNTWLSMGDAATELSLRKYPESSVEKMKYEAYAAADKIDYPAFYARAFALGLYVLYKEDPLGRGGFE